MQQGLNRVTLIGRLAAAPEIRHAPSGLAVASFVMQVPRQWSGPDGQIQETLDSFNVVAWGELAEQGVAPLTAGGFACVEGRLQVRSWQDAEGRLHQQTEIVAGHVLALNP